MHLLAFGRFLVFTREFQMKIRRLKGDLVFLADGSVKRFIGTVLSPSGRTSIISKHSDH